MDAGLSIERTYHLLYEHKFEQGNGKISKPAIYNLVRRLKPKIANVKNENKEATIHKMTGAEQGISFQNKY